jgi:adenine-specific DNA-methyltransferase
MKGTNYMESIFETLEKTLLQDERLVAEGKLLKNKAIELVLKMDTVLLKLILTNNELSSFFFITIDDVKIFDTRKFQWTLNNKNFLPDSYTTFKNKIGLQNNRGEFFNETSSIELVWPYKDCILEGGQTKEDQKRNEIFWNETLAPEEIDRLLHPKVLTNFRKFTNEGEKTSDISFDFSEENLIIHGNNLLALHSLKKRYTGKVKLIYIDPPYNTENDEFKYNDRFSHSTWLTFMKNRLSIARELLHDKGVIYIHIGDQEMHYLKVLTDEIFGRESFIATIPRKTRNGKSDVPYKLSQDFDWMLVYTKRASKSDKLFQRTIQRKYHKSSDFPNDEWRLSDLTKQTSITERPNSNFTLVNPRNGQEFPVNPNRSWAISKDTEPDYIARKKIVFPGDYDFLSITQPAMRVFKSEEIEKNGEDFDKAYVSSDFQNNVMDDLLKKTLNKAGTDEIVELFGEKAFSYPKNELLLQRIIEFSTKEGDIVLDFFAGSGTTLAVAHKMNRRYIGIEQMDYIDSILVERLKKVINGEQGGISENAEVEWQGGGSFVYCQLKEVNQSYVDRIQLSTRADELDVIWEEMKGIAHLSYKVNIKAFDANKVDFDQLSMEDKQHFLIECLDKNMLYVNYCDIEDDDFTISNEDIKINNLFYERR